MSKTKPTNEEIRLKQAHHENKGWLKWGPYLSERQWGTVREDYSAGGNAWEFFPHDHARSRVYRWGEDGIAGISDDFQNLCFAIALWNGKDPILKERIFGLTGNEGNHGEDCKELYYYLDNTPTHSYMKHLYKYPQAEFPYADLVHTNGARSKEEREYELLDTGVFNENRYFDVFTEYAKADEDDILIKIKVCNRGPESADLSLLPTLWYRNLWSFGVWDQKPQISQIEGLKEYGGVKASHFKLGDYYLYHELSDRSLFTENETNNAVYGMENENPFVKDAFHRAVVENDFDFLEGNTYGTKFSPLYNLTIPADGEVEVKLRMTNKEAMKNPLKTEFDKVFTQRAEEADEFYGKFRGAGDDQDLALIQRQALAGMLWTKQYYNIDMEIWLDGDKGQFPPPESRKYGRNKAWRTLNNEDIISMPDKWEYPWYAAWDLAFHCVPLAMVDPDFAKNQLILIMREWYMAPNGQIPAYEWAFGDVNPPVHAWAALEVFKLEKEYFGKADYSFLKRVFQKLMLNFTWWVNRKDSNGNNIFEGGFLGLDNIGVFDRSNQLPGGGTLEQADGTSWMAMFSLNMMEMALVICEKDCDFEDVATKFFEHFAYIAESINRVGDDWTSAWDEEEGFFYDILHLQHSDEYIPLKVRSLVGLAPLFAVTTLEQETLKNVPEFVSRMKWFQNYRDKLQKYPVLEEFEKDSDLLLSLVHKGRLERLLQALLDEKEFLAPGGIRSISKIHEKYYNINIDGQDYGLNYQPGESNTHLFGGNSNWRGPVWMPMSYILTRSIRKYAKYYGDDFKVEYPTGSGNQLRLDEVAEKLCERMVSIFQKDKHGKRPVHDNHPIYEDEHFRDLVLFYEYFHGDNSRGIGATHQTGWTGVVAELIESRVKKII